MLKDTSPLSPDRLELLLSQTTTDRGSLNLSPTEPPGTPSLDSTGGQYFPPVLVAGEGGEAEAPAVTAAAVTTREEGTGGIEEGRRREGEDEGERRSGSVEPSRVLSSLSSSECSTWIHPHHHHHQEQQQKHGQDCSRHNQPQEDHQLHHHHQRQNNQHIHNHHQEKFQQRHTQQQLEEQVSGAYVPDSSHTHPSGFRQQQNQLVDHHDHNQQEHSQQQQQQLLLEDTCVSSHRAEPGADSYERHHHHHQRHTSQHPQHQEQAGLGDACVATSPNSYRRHDIPDEREELESYLSGGECGSSSSLRGDQERLQKQKQRPQELGLKDDTSQTSCVEVLDSSTVSSCGHHGCHGNPHRHHHHQQENQHGLSDDTSNHQHPHNEHLHHQEQQQQPQQKEEPGLNNTTDSPCAPDSHCGVSLSSSLSCQQQQQHHHHQNQPHQDDQQQQHQPQGCCSQHGSVDCFCSGGVGTIEEAGEDRKRDRHNQRQRHRKRRTGVVGTYPGHPMKKLLTWVKTFLRGARARLLWSRRCVRRGAGHQFGFVSIQSQSFSSFFSSSSVDIAHRAATGGSCAGVGVVVGGGGSCGDGSSSASSVLLRCDDAKAQHADDNDNIGDDGKTTAAGVGCVVSRASPSRDNRQVAVCQGAGDDVSGVGDVTSSSLTSSSRDKLDTSSSASQNRHHDHDQVDARGVRCVPQISSSSLSSQSNNSQVVLNHVIELNNKDNSRHDDDVDDDVDDDYDEDDDDDFVDDDDDDDERIYEEIGGEEGVGDDEADRLVTTPRREEGCGHNAQRSRRGRRGEGRRRRRSRRGGRGKSLGLRAGRRLLVSLGRTCKQRMTSVTAVSLLWSLLSLLVAGACAFSFFHPTWISHPDKLHSFGLFTQCVRDQGAAPRPRAVCHGYGPGGRVDVGSIPAGAWQASTLLFGAGAGLQCLGALATLMLILLPWHPYGGGGHRLALLCGYMQTLAVLLLVSGLVMFPLGFSTAFFHYYCDSSGAYCVGHCRMGWGYVLAITATALAIFCPVLSNYTDVTFDKDGDGSETEAGGRDRDRVTDV